MTWAREHLRASQGFRVVNPMTGILLQIPSLVPAKQANGHCHWLQPDGQCGVHENSPFGCAFVDQHMKDSVAEKQKRRAGRTGSPWRTFEADGLRTPRVWHMLMAEGLTGGGEHAEAMAELRRIKAKLARRAENQACKRASKEEEEALRR